MIPIILGAVLKYDRFLVGKTLLYNLWGRNKLKGKCHLSWSFDGLHVNLLHWSEYKSVQSLLLPPTLSPPAPLLSSWEA